MNPVIIIVLAFSLILPIGLMIWWKKKTGATLCCFLAGAICFFLFAEVLEALLHQLCLGTDNAFSRTVMSSPVLYMLYGGFAAGIFEETGRLFGYKVLLRKHKEKECAVAYGIGHGGIEVLLILGATYLIYLLISLGVTVGDEAITAQMREISGNITFSTACLGMAERISAMLLHIGLSMLMFTAARKKEKLWLYPVSICLHALADMPACLYQIGVIRSIPVVELIALAMGVVYLLIGRRVINNNISGNPSL